MPGVCLALLLAPRPAQRQRDPLTLRKSTSCATPPWIPTSGSNCTSRLRGPGWRRSSRRGPIPRQGSRRRRPTTCLQDFLDVYDELNENIDTYVGRKSDLRKVLKTVIEADTEFQAKLRALRDAANAQRKRPSNTNSCSRTRSKPSTTAPRIIASCWPSRKRPQSKRNRLQSRRLVN